MGLPSWRRPPGQSGGEFEGEPHGSEVSFFVVDNQRPRPAWTTNVSEYGWVWSSGPRPGSLSTTKERHLGAVRLALELAAAPVSYTHLTLPTTPYV